MKTFAIILFFLFFNNIYSQRAVESNFADCENYNYFIKSESHLNEIKNMVYEVRENGTILFNPSTFGSIAKKEIEEDIFNLNSDYSFIKIDESVNRFNSKKKTLRYQQYYKGVFVEGGGYSEVTSNPSDSDPEPCAITYLVAPYIATNISINVFPVILEQDIISILSINAANNILPVNLVQKELVISPNINDDCEYNLVWKVTYQDGGTKISWIDANSGQILKTIDDGIFINAPTEIYGNVFLDDLSIDGTTSLISSDGTKKVYNFYDLFNCDESRMTDYTDDKIPFTVNSEWTPNDTRVGLYQCFYVTQTLKEIFSTMGINFETINVGAECQELYGRAFFGSSLDNAFIVIGKIDYYSIGTFDIIGHELAHVYLYDYIDATGLRNGSIHEGLSDIIGTYVENLYQNSIDWKLGDDVPGLSVQIRRDLENTVNNCYLNVEDFPETHTRGEPLGHFYYLISEGDQSSDIPSLGATKSLEILLESLKLLSRNPDYNQVRDATFNVVLEDFGRCSQEFLAIARAWEKICVATPYSVNGLIPDCNFTLYGPDQVCEEDGHVSICVDGGLPNAEYKWRIIGNQSNEFTSLLGMDGNTQFGGRCLDLISFPEYPYYPQTILIEAYDPAASYAFKQKKYIKIKDCDHDDPSCHDYYNQSEAKLSSVQEANCDEKDNRVRVFDLYGRLLYEGEEGGWLKSNQNYGGLAIIQYFYPCQNHSQRVEASLFVNH